MAEYELTDVAKTALLIYRSHMDLTSYVYQAQHSKVLMDLGLEKDVEYCLKKDLFDIVPEYKHGIIKLEF